MMRRKLVAGNWKMNGLQKDRDFLSALVDAHPDAPAADVLLCPPATLLSAMASARPDWLLLGGQDCAQTQSGAHTGDISAAMLADLGCSHVIVGHSERRSDHGEGDALVRAKAEAALEAGLVPIICVGETLEQRESGEAEAVVISQLRASTPECEAGSVVIAYEPVWAIGTGRIATLEDIASMHAAIRAVLPHGAATRILYGGSVKPDNAAGILALDDVDGALVGGASLTVDAFAGIISASSGCKTNTG